MRSETYKTAIRTLKQLLSDNDERYNTRFQVLSPVEREALQTVIEEETDQ